MATTYRITIEKAQDADSRDFTTEVVITCDSIYTIDTDLVEWVKEEIDPSAIVNLDPPQFQSVCRECADRNHEDCIDGTRISAVPYSCLCAINGHASR